MMTSAAADSKGTAAAVGEKSSPAPIVVDLGRQKQKRVRQLRKGKGPLIADVNSTIDELRATGTISASAQPVIVVVREKLPKGIMSMLKL
jgi:uncharacterized protein DUF6200